MPRLLDGGFAMLCDKCSGLVMAGVFGGQACPEFAECVGGAGGVDGAAACEGLAGDGTGLVDVALVSPWSRWATAARVRWYRASSRT